MTDGELLERFLARRDESAFESVVLRHGSMVLRLCREVLGNTHDAEDAFQATFLVLVNNASAIRDQDALGRWLYGVAYRIAVRAKVRARRRQTQERQGVEMAAAAPENDALPQDYLPVVHAELNRLPTKIRDPLVLCYLEGLTQEEAARQLDCPLGTLKGRLTKGRELLRSRLGRRGLALSLIVLLLNLLEQKASAAIPDALLASTVKAGVRLAARRSALSGTGSSANRLARTEINTRRFRRFFLLGVGMLALLGVGGARLVQGALHEDPPPAPAPPPRAAIADPSESPCGTMTIPGKPLTSNHSPLRANQ
jgi:RNA polymerase sigma-70 factor (ECF subfamily)